jgi:pimeloyl-ACP methyl ester carboxylesterase
MLILLRGLPNRGNMKNHPPLLIKIGVLCVGVLVSARATVTEKVDHTKAPWPGEKSSFHSFAQYDFEVQGISCKVVVPARAAEEKPWIWRARFWGHEPQTDLALLERGFHIAYIDVAGLFGSPEALRRWDRFYDVLTRTHGFDKKAVLEGMSRGGLIVFNWASRNPEKVHCIYADAPVCDFKSWPGGKEGAEKQWRQCLDAYGLTEEAARSFKGNPVDNLEPLAKAGVPILVVVGDADDVVPVAENTARVEQRYHELDGDITVIHKPGIGHHPHSLEDPKPIVDFILRHASPL